MKVRFLTVRVAERRGIKATGLIKHEDALYKGRYLRYFAFSCHSAPTRRTTGPRQATSICVISVGNTVIARELHLLYHNNNSVVNKDIDYITFIAAS